MNDNWTETQLNLQNDVHLATVQMNILIHTFLSLLSSWRNDGTLTIYKASIDNTDLTVWL